MNKQPYTYKPQPLSKVECMIFEISRLQDEVTELLESRDYLEYGHIEDRIR